MNDTDRLQDLARRVADGEPVDWEAEEGRLSDPEDRAALRGLRRMAEIAEAQKGNGSSDSQELSSTITRLPDSATRGERIGPYRILQKMGEGGMGEVWEAEQQSPVRRRVALKLIKWGMDTKSVVARFESERQALALMDHPGIAKVFDAGATETGRPYFVMEHVQGVPITRYCDTHRLTTRERLELFMRVCHAVQHAHQKGIIHRDIKASNVLVSIQDAEPVPKIIDFGVAKATQQRLTEKTVFTELGQLIGTPEYMSPEQAEMTGLDIDTRTDVYSLGVLLYQLLTGLLPFDPKELRGSGFDEIRRKIREEEPSRPSTRVSTLDGEAATTLSTTHQAELPALRKQLKGDLDWITMKALEKDRTRRYQSASELASDIERHLAHQPVVASPPSTVYRARKFVRRHKVGVAAGMVVAVALVLGITGATVGLVRARRAEAQVRQEAEAAKQVSDFLVGLFEVSDPSEARGNTITAREILDRGAEKIERELTEQSTIQARLMETMGRVYRTLGLYDPALDLVNDALAIRRHSHGDDHPTTLACATELGRVEVAKGRYVKAEETLRPTLETQLHVLGEEHPDVVRSLLALASSYRGQRRQDDAELLQKRALEIARRLYGNDHRVTASALESLAVLTNNRTRFEQAEHLAAEALEIRRRVLGADHPATHASLGLLATIYQNQGHHEKALPILEEALDNRRRVLGAEHPTTLEAMGVLAMVYQNLNQPDEAERRYKEFLELGGRVLGTQHPRILYWKSRLGRLYENLGRYDEAARLHEEVLDARRDVLGESAGPTLASMHNLAAVRMLQGRVADAEGLARRAVAIAQRHLGDEHRRTLRNRRSLGKLYRDLGSYQRAESEYRQALEVQKRVLGEEDGDTLKSMLGLASLYSEQGRYDEAESLQLETLEIQRRVLGEMHADVRASLYNLACLLAKTDRRGEALDRLRQAAAAGFTRADWMARDADLASLHGDPEFEAIVAEVRKRAEQEDEARRGNAR